MKRIILSRTDRIGDVVLTTAAFEPLRQAFPNASLRILVRPELVPLLRHVPGVEAVACPPEAGAKGFHFSRYRKWKDYFQKESADCIVFLHPDNDLQFAAAAAGIPKRLGYRKQIGRFALNDSLPYTRHLGTRHEAQCNFELLARIGCPGPEKPIPFLPLEDSPPSQRHSYAIFHPAAFGDKPRWSAEKYATLAKRLVEDFGWKIVLVGSEPSESTVEAFRSAGLSEDAWEDRGGKDSLVKTAALLRGARVVVSRDSGPAHLAAAVGAPLVCLMGQCDPIHSPTRWAPLGTGVKTLVSDLPPRKGESRQERWKRCFEAIRVDEVLAAVRELVRS